MALDDAVRITEFAAAENVAGSKLLVDYGEKTLVDCGLEYRDGEENEPLPFDAGGIDHLLLTHGHADHVGQMLKLFSAGFSGDVYCTRQTADLTKLQLTQSVNGPFMHNTWARGKRFLYGPQKGQFIPFQKIRFRSRDVRDAIAHFVSDDGLHAGFPYEKPIRVSEKMTATFYEAGHIPGSAQILLEIQTGERPKKILFAYDLGRTDYKLAQHPIADIPIVRFPHTDFPGDIDDIVIEATYGDKVHGNLDDSIGALEEAFTDAAKKRGD